MNEFMAIVLLLLTLGIGLVFLKATMMVVSLTGRWNNFMWGWVLLDQRLIERIRLMEDDPIEYSKKFPHVVTLIRISGTVCLFISISGFCIAILDNVTK